MKHCISEFVFPTGPWAGAVNAYRMQRVGKQNLRDRGGFEGRVVEQEQGGGGQTLGESVTVHDCYATTTGWARKGADRLTHRRQV